MRMAGMKTRWRLLPLAAGIALLLGGAGARADSDQDRARAAVQAGQVLPLASLLQRLEREYPGQLLEVELEDDDGRLIYEVRLLQADGRLLKLKLDAASGETLRVRAAGGTRGREREHGR